ncbi:MAG: capsid protein [Avonheates virus SG_479]|uniref:capsid protein n=1 Tax=Avonheates virus SG_479 TaxID=2914485 RepID=UPI002481BB98|nr:MAG: capsid protein [Avonheates virus SG_479]UNI72635.1 MAG: capsid protein [Avonheates virus SG_479]
MTELRSQLEVLHDPFSDATAQPKIPDGKVNDSLGFTTSKVLEMGNRTSSTEIHCLLHAGQNCGMTLQEVDLASGATTYYNVGFDGSNVCDWSAAGHGTTTPFTVSSVDKYALWRVVSAGLQLKLLNPTEEDDGWWEAVRVNVAHDSAGWMLHLTDGATNPATNGCIVPTNILNNFRTSGANLANDSTYSTGLLRDLHRVQFELHGRTDYHDFTHQKGEMAINDGIVLVSKLGTSDDQVLFDNGHDDVHEMIDNFVDSSYDMIYLRLHCRANTGTGNQLGSRFHTHLVSNQEIYFPENSRESRFHTKGDSIGPQPMGVHFQGRRAMQNAATLIG